MNEMLSIPTVHIEDACLQRWREFEFCEGKFVENLLRGCAFANSNGLVGFGVSGHLAASIVGVVRGTDVCFIRESAKKYGTQKILDGAYDSGLGYVGFCEIDKQHDFLEECRRCGVNVTAVITFQVVRISSLSCTTKVDIYPNIECPHCFSEVIFPDYVKRLNSGPYTLSSGARSDFYYETLPAANTYPVIAKAFQQGRFSVNEVDFVCGIAHGGVYIGVAYGMWMKKLTLIYNPSILDCYGREKEEKVYDKFKNALIVDDYITTGSIVTQIANESSLSNISKFSTISLYKKKKVMLSSLDNLNVIYELDD